MPTEASIPLDLGSYTAAEAGRLIRVQPRTIRHWMEGYAHGGRPSVKSLPLWKSQLSMIDDHLEIGFRDLVELRFVKAFVDAGIGLKAVRNCLALARDLVGSERPFSTHRFRTDGETIFLESAAAAGEPELLDLKRRQHAFHRIIERSFKDLDILGDSIESWRPYGGKKTILIDPRRSFGRPITAEAGVPTAVLTAAVRAEGSARRVEKLFDVPASIIRDAIDFEDGLKAA